MTPVGFVEDAGALVAWTAAVGTAVGCAEPPDDGADVAGTAVACGADVGDVEPLSDCGVAVADDPHANNSATNSNTIAFGKFLNAVVLSDDISKNLLLSLRITFTY